MKRTKLCVFVVCAVFAAALFASCSKKEANQGELKSMEQIHEEQGVPVTLRQMRPALFTTFFKYPAAFIARSESTAKAAVTDVVRTVHGKIGESVKKDQVILAFSQDNPAYQQAKANYENARSVYRRTQALFKDNGVSQQNLDNARTQFEVAEAGLKAMDDAINVKAPISGFITRLDVRVTENVQPGAVLFTVSNLERVEARIWVSAKDIGFVSPGMAVIAEWLGEKISGQVTQVNMIMDTEKKAFLVLAEFRNTGRILTSGMTMDTVLQTYRNDNAIFIHRKELVTENGVPCVYVAVNETAQRREVTLGKTQGLLLEITQGLESGDLLISGGSQMVHDGSKVYAVKVVDSLEAK
ncbi:MAG: efflux RND transporter periplasmic adaptor subunit [Spirochaetales bacterium]|nr:efflux RND transporter periplasmic adaptor subunit [Spirochaetales bacterium]